MIEIRPPTPNDKNSRSELTPEGEEYKAQCKQAGDTPKYYLGLHYIATEADARILMPDLAVLHGLRHRWCWERRQRLHVPVWAYAKMPHARLAAEENCRVTSTYFRPCCLNPKDANKFNPLLENLGRVIPSPAHDSVPGNFKTNTRLIKKRHRM